MPVPRNPVFIDDDAARVFQRTGYLVLDFLDASEVTSLRNSYAVLESGLSMGFIASMFSADAEYRRTVNETIIDVFARPLGSIVHRHKCLLGSFLEKKPAPSNGEVPLHQDWTFVDESQFQSLNFWCALEDVDDENGCMQVLPGSHHFQHHPRAPFGSAPWIAAFGRELGSDLIPIHMRSGQVLIHDHRLWHASSVNRRQVTRLAAACVVVPKEAEPMHYCQVPGDELDVYDQFRVDEAFFADYRIGSRPPGRYPFERIIGAPQLPTVERLQTYKAIVRSAKMELVDEKLEIVH